MSSANDDVVIADGMLEQVWLQIHVKRDLRAAEMVAVRRRHGLRLNNEITIQLRATPFEQGIVSQWQQALYGHADARLEMRADDGLIAHCEWNSAMRQHGGLVSKLGRVGHESHLAT